MKIMSRNVNGLRSAEKKDFLKSFKKINPDIFCLQEVRANDSQLNEKIKNIKDYYFILNPAAKKGYAGTAIFSKIKPIKLEKKINFKKFDSDGRVLILHFRKFILINIYMPHGSRDKKNLNYKLKSYEKLFSFLKNKTNKKIILLGDFNIAHTEMDLERPKQNKNNIMFTEKEREQITKLIKLGFVDTFRTLHPKTKKYSWWPYFHNARKRNLGWRIDYIFTSKKLFPKIKKAFILNKIFDSDHCPVGVELK